MDIFQKKSNFNLDLGASIYMPAKQTLKGFMDGEAYYVDVVMPENPAGTERTSPANVQVIAWDESFYVYWEVTNVVDYYLVEIKEGATVVSSISTEDLFVKFDEAEAGLVNGTEYNVTVTGVFNGQEASADVVNFTPAAKTPQNLTRTAISATEVSVEWDAIATAFKHYKVYLKNTDTDEIEQEIGGILTNSATIFGLTDGVNYEVWVTTISDLNIFESDASTSITFTAADAPEAPTNFAVDTGALEASWDEVVGVDGYNLYLKSPISEGHTYKYYKLEIVGSASSVASIKEWGLFPEAEGMALGDTLPLSEGGTATASLSTGLDYLFDGLITTNLRWQFGNAPDWAQWEFPQATTIKSYNVGPPNGSGFHPTDWNLLGSNDGVTWDTLDEQRYIDMTHWSSLSAIAPLIPVGVDTLEGAEFEKHNTSLIEALTYSLASLEEGDYEAYVVAVRDGLESEPSNVVEFTVDLPEPYTYYRINVLDNNGSAISGGPVMGIAEIEFIDVNDVDLTGTESGTPSASSSNGGQVASEAFTDDLTDMWSMSPSAGFPSWIQFLFDEAQIITKYSIAGYAASGRYPGACAKDWDLQASNDGVTWDTLHSVRDADASVWGSWTGAPKVLEYNIYS